jgi:hypothetical protein
MMRSLIFVAAVLSAPFGIASVEAQQQHNAQGQVVHNRLAPVLLHRAVPPFRGQHVYNRAPRR